MDAGGEGFGSLISRFTVARGENPADIIVSNGAVVQGSPILVEHLPFQLTAVNQVPVE